MYVSLLAIRTVILLSQKPTPVPAWKLEVVHYAVLTNSHTRAPMLREKHPRHLSNIGYGISPQFILWSLIIPPNPTGDTPSAAPPTRCTSHYMFQVIVSWTCVDLSVPPVNFTGSRVHAWVQTRAPVANSALRLCQPSHCLTHMRRSSLQPVSSTYHWTALSYLNIV